MTRGCLGPVLSNAMSRPVLIQAGGSGQGPLVPPQTPRQPRPPPEGWVPAEVGKGVSLGLHREAGDRADDTAATGRPVAASLWWPLPWAERMALQAGAQAQPSPGTPWDQRHSQAGTNLITSCALL